MITKILPDEIKTERLVLRRPEKRDTEDFFKYASKKTVGPMAGWQPHQNNR
jgi:RimJ/RimL family protein N-acetyltransferase